MESKLVNNNKYIETKTVSHTAKIITALHDTGIPNDGYPCIYHIIILTDSVFKIGKNCYPGMLLKM